MMRISPAVLGKTRAIPWSKATMPRTCARTGYWPEGQQPGDHRHEQEQQAEIDSRARGRRGDHSAGQPVTLRVDRLLAEKAGGHLVHARSGRPSPKG
jgi:hypothetical protein